MVGKIAYVERREGERGDEAEGRVNTVGGLAGDRRLAGACADGNNVVNGWRGRRVN